MRFLLVAVLLVLAAPQLVSADTINLRSGNGDPGESDPFITVRGAAATVCGVYAGAAPIPLQQAKVLGNYSYYPPITGTQFVGVYDVWACPVGCYLYEIQFSLPTYFREPSLEFHGWADDAFELYLNGLHLGNTESVPWHEDGNLACAVLSCSNASAFVSGTNTIDIYVRNMAGGPTPTGLTFRASVNYVPEPSSMLALAGGLAGLLGFRRTRLVR